MQTISTPMLAGVPSPPFAAHETIDALYTLSAIDSLCRCGRRVSRAPVHPGGGYLSGGGCGVSLIGFASKKHWSRLPTFYYQHALNVRRGPSVPRYFGVTASVRQPCLSKHHDFRIIPRGLL